MARITIGLSVFLIVCFLFSASATPASANIVDCTDTATTGVSQLECEALVALYNSTNGPAWTNSGTNNWLTHSSISTWTGVVVSGGHVVGMLNLSYNNLSGPLPPEIGNLKGVDYFYFRNNHLTGAIPPEIADVPGILYLYLNNNELTGEIPPQLFSLSAIRDLILYGNHLSGQIPTEVGNATTLKRFMVHNNDLTGELPASLGNLTSLTHFSVDGNDLFGQLPPSMASWPTSMSQFTIGQSGFWTTDTGLISYLDLVVSGWESAQLSQALEPSNHSYVGWGKLENSSEFSPRLVFSKLFYRNGSTFTAAEKYKVSIYKADSTKIMEVELADAEVCPAGGPEITAVCTYAPMFSDFSEPLTPGDYYWTIATDKEASVDWLIDNNHEFELISSPPVVMYPTNITTKVNPTFKWQPVEHANSYNLVVINSSSAKVMDEVVLNSNCDTSECSYSPTASILNLSNGEYIWKVRADLGVESYTDWGSASFLKIAPPAPLFPAKSSTTPNPKFTWKPVPDHGKYQIKLVTSSNVPIRNVTVVCTSTILCSYTFNPALTLANGAYKWQVRAYDGMESGTYSAYKVFNKVAPPAPKTPAGIITSNNPKFTWKKIPGASKYYIVLQRSSGVLVRNMEVTTLTCDAVNCWYTPNPVLNLAKGDYKWKVRAFNGYYGWYSGYKLFTRK